MKFLIVCLFVSLFVSVAIADDEVFVFTMVKKGDVAFNHTTHQTYNDCETCHPKFPEVFNDDISIKVLGHTFCKKCHKGAGMSISCSSCHQ